MNNIIQNFNSLKIRTKLVVLLVAVGLVPVAILGVSLSINAHNTVVKNRKNDMTNSLSQACAAVNSQIEVCEHMADYFVYDQNVIQFLECSPEKKTERYGLYQEVRNTISALEYQNLILQSITIYSESLPQSYGKETQPLKVLKEQPWFSQQDEEQIWVYDQDSLKMVSVHKIPSYSGLESYAVVNSNILALFQSLEQLATGSYGVHVEGEEEIWNFAGKECVNEDGTYCSFVGKEDNYIWVEEKIPRLGIRVFYFTPRDSVADSLAFISWNQIVAVFLQICGCIVLIMVLGRLFSNYISRPLELLTKDIQTVTEKNMETGVTSKRGDEIGILINSYNRMMQRIQELIQENYETKIAQKEFEMKALQAQINPHFLYNSLSMINWKALEAGEKEISRITLSLSFFYRTTLNRGQTMNTIKNAMENIRSYLTLQLYMHDDDFQVHYEIEEDVYEYVIPMLIFQPLVENALEHGLDLKEDSDHQIWITVTQDLGNIYIRIRDNGVGMDDWTAAHILEYDTKGYGVKNVSDRMMLHYGEDYKPVIESRLGQGTSVLLKFPKEQGGDAKNV